MTNNQIKLNKTTDCFGINPKLTHNLPKSNPNLTSGRGYAFTPNLTPNLTLNLPKFNPFFNPNLTQICSNSDKNRKQRVAIREQHAYQGMRSRKGGAVNNPYLSSRSKPSGATCQECQPSDINNRYGLTSYSLTALDAKGGTQNNATIPVGCFTANEDESKFASRFVSRANGLDNRQNDGREMFHKLTPFIGPKGIGHGESRRSVHGSAVSNDHCTAMTTESLVHTSIPPLET